LENGAATFSMALIGLIEVRKRLKPVDWLVEELSDAECDAEALQQLLPKLRKLDRSEAWAYATINRALGRERSQFAKRSHFSRRRHLVAAAVGFSCTPGANA
jgi:hypothetical protein